MLESDITRINDIILPLEEQNLTDREFLDKLKNDNKAKLVFV